MVRIRYIDGKTDRWNGSIMNLLEANVELVEDCYPPFEIIPDDYTMNRIDKKNKTKRISLMK